MDYELIRNRFINELGNPPEELFEEFDVETFAAASLGQVHRAQLHDGTNALVKVQYPGVGKIVESDLKNARAVINALTLVARDVIGNDNMDYGGVHDELKGRMEEELDYENEARNLELLQGLYADAADDEVEIPKVIHERSRRRVLTMTYVDSYKIRDILAPGVDQELNDWVMLKLYDITWQQLLCFGIVHVDPHPGNYLVTHHPHLGMLDFSCIRVLSQEIQTAYHEMNRALLELDDELLHDSFFRLAFLKPGDDPVLMAKVLRKMFGPVLHDRPIDPRTYDSMEMATEAIRTGLKAGYGRAPAHRVFLDRVLIGIDGYLKLAATTANWHETFRKWVYADPIDLPTGRE